MTIFRMYADNGNRAGFWVQHRSWPNTCAQIRSIGGRRDGRLPGAAPLHGGVAVIVRVFDVRSGRAIAPPHVLEHPDDRNYARIAEPAWSNRSGDGNGGGDDADRGDNLGSADGHDRRDGRDSHFASRTGPIA
jgi:hypothetical protein